MSPEKFLEELPVEAVPKKKGKEKEDINSKKLSRVENRGEERERDKLSDFPTLHMGTEGRKEGIWRGGEFLTTPIRPYPLLFPPPVSASRSWVQS